jgi:hypothetical protein
VAARRRGTITIEINPDRTPLSDLVVHRLTCNALSATDGLAERLGMRR